MKEEDAEVVTVAIGAGMAVIVQLIQLTLELSRMYGLSQENLQALIDVESETFAQNTPDKLPDPITVSASEDDLK